VLTRDADIRDLFLELVAIPSPSGRELVLAEQIAGWLNDAGVSTRFDGSGPDNGSDAGNLIATVPGAPGRSTLLFVAHMDTVETGAEAVRPLVDDDDVIRSAGDTILGADNKSAVAAVMRTCLAARQLPAAHRATVVAAFTSREESGRMGASLLDLPSLGVDCAFCRHPRSRRSCRRQSRGRCRRDRGRVRGGGRAPARPPAGRGQRRRGRDHRRLGDRPPGRRHGVLVGPRDPGCSADQLGARPRLRARRGSRLQHRRDRRHDPDGEGHLPTGV
jgi:tripeptide aminopeptidase